MYTLNDCTDEHFLTTDLKNRYLILKPEFLKDEYMDEKYQLVIALEGFGCIPNGPGIAIFVKEVNDNPSSYKINKANYDILGIAKDEVVTRHKQKYLK